MKLLSSLLITVALIGVHFSSYSQTTFYYDTIDQLQVKAIQENQYFILDFYTDWCKPCKKMDAEVFSTSQAGNYLRDNNFIVKKINAERGDEAYLASLNNVNAYPTFIIFNSRGKEIGRIIGYYSTSAFIEKLKSFKHKVPNQSFTDFR